MSDTRILHFVKPSDEILRLEPGTCTEAETFALQVLDKSMEPEFREHCIIVVDPTGHATDGSYVLAQQPVSPQRNQSGGTDADVDAKAKADADADDTKEILESFLFRQLRRNPDGKWILCALNEAFGKQSTAQDLSEIIGVIVQRAGTRRRYHKHYD